MKKLAVFILAVIGVSFGTSFAASAADGYPPGATPKMLATSPVAVNGTITVTISNMTPGLKGTVSISGAPLAQGEATQADSQQVTIGASGSVITTLTAPAKAGTYRVTGNIGTSVLYADVVVTATTSATTTTLKPTNTVPATGSNTPFTGIAIGLPLLVGGLALLVVSRRRRAITL